MGYGRLGQGNLFPASRLPRRSWLSPPFQTATASSSPPGCWANRERRSRAGTYREHCRFCQEKVTSRPAPANGRRVRREIHLTGKAPSRRAGTKAPQAGARLGSTQKQEGLVRHVCPALIMPRRFRRRSCVGRRLRPDGRRFGSRFRRSVFLPLRRDEDQRGRKILAESGNWRAKGDQGEPRGKSSWVGLHGRVPYPRSARGADLLTPQPAGKNPAEAVVSNSLSARPIRVRSLLSGLEPVSSRLPPIAVERSPTIYDAGTEFPRDSAKTSPSRSGGPACAICRLPAPWPSPPCRRR